MTTTLSAGIGQLSDRDLAVYLSTGLAANALVAVGFPKVGGMLAAVVLATYIAAISC